MVEPLAERPVADPIVVLDEEYETPRIEPGRLGAAILPSMDRVLPLIEPAAIERRDEVGDRPSKVAVDAVIVASQQASNLVMEIIRPDTVKAPAAIRLRLEHAGQIAVILGNEMDRSGRLVRPDSGGQLREEVTRALVDHRVSRVDAQAIHVIFVDPVQGILDEELADQLALGTVEVDGGPPGSAMLSGKVIGTEEAEIAAIGSEMVVDDVEQHRHSQAVGDVDQGTQVVGAAVAPGRCEEGDSVIPQFRRPGKSATGMSWTAVIPSRARSGSRRDAAANVPSVVKAPM